MSALSQPVYRFAPSPNGYLHLGHAFSALTNQAWADKNGGRLLLRIEDIDPDRCRPEYEAAIHDDLHWLGIGWEEPVRRQSEHIDAYRQALDRLMAMGLIYPAFLSRAEIRAIAAQSEADGRPWRRDPDGALHYPVGERDLDPAVAAEKIAAGARHMLRLNMDRALEHVQEKCETVFRPDMRKNEKLEHVQEKCETVFRPQMRENENALAQLSAPLVWTEKTDEDAMRITADPAAWGDVILWRWDAPSSYHLSVVVDDALQGVSHVVRGKDLYHATSVHRLLQHLLDLPVPFYTHHRLVLGEDGRKLSKSEKAAGIRQLREDGVSASALRHRLGFA
ncbi:glutamate--tRNA ligase family protein [Allorhizobium sp. BGMRC 0089]|uniref:glutamate--tRNA ligase family protein n=1 Tax=Allorhizobium sonneratiae TaxID=2934936 RepID=UPI002033AE84|nr:glutamate--tRNA ligase family protein [Allorhizobium sonneratiae]MCM2293530.1 glutamate--tRNA ligase family protein [Allorhizobium sonneratiae]